MTDEPASGPEKNDASARDPLALAADSKNPELDYQWFRWGTSATGTPRVGDMAPERGGWQPVARQDMPKEPSHNNEFIQRWEMRLYARARGLSERAKMEAMAQALAPVQAIEAALFGRYPSPWSGMGSADYRTVARLPRGGGGYDAPPAKEWVPFLPRRNGFESEGKYSWEPNRGRILILHQYLVNPRLWPWLLRFWRSLLRCRVCCLPHEEAELAERQGTSFGQWAWAKRDLLREGVIPYRRPQFKFTVKTVEIKLPKVPWRQWVARLRATIKR